MQSALCCASCGALNPLPPDGHFDYFDIFGFSRGYDLDTAALHRRYLALSRWVHPDTREDRSDAARRQALALSAELNRAYETLRDPVARADYILSIAGGPSAIDHKSVPGCLLGEVMMFREEIEEATSKADMATLQDIRQRVLEQRQVALEQIATLCRGPIQDAPVRKQLREHLNTVKYWNNLLEQISAASAR